MHRPAHLSLLPLVSIVSIIVCPLALAQKNTAPVAEAGGPYTGTVGQAITFDGTASYDPDLGDHITKHEWDFDGDGKYEAQGKKVTKTYYSPTSGTVRLRVWDSRGASDTDSATYKIKNQNPNQDPVADAGGPYQGTVGELITLDGSGSYDPDGQIVGWHWDLDDDGQYDDAFGEIVQYTWNQPYTGIIHLRVIDAVQAFDTDSASVTVVKPNQSPVAKAGGPYTGAAGQAVQLDASDSYDPDGHIIAWDWDLDKDGQYDDASGEVISWQWNEAWSGEIGLKVTDNDNATDTADASVTISPKTKGIIQGMVFHDRNRNGEQDQKEEGLGGWLVYLDDNRNGQHDQAEPVTRSKLNGRYQFPELEPGKYAVGLILEDDTWDLIHPANGQQEVLVTENEITILGFALYKTIRYDYGDAPDPNFPTLWASGGARHRLGGLCLGTRIDAELDGQSHFNAQGDDFDANGDDEEGIVIRSIIRPGMETRFDLTITNHQSEVQYTAVACWLDVDGNGRWDLPDEQLEYWLLTARPGENTWDLGLDIPTDAVVGMTYARFRLYRRESSEDSVVLSPEGDGGVGEVEDYLITIMDPDASYDFGDAAEAPYPTLLPEGAWHTIIPGLHLGDLVDGEENGAPDLSALGDGDDEDGVGFPADLVPGESAPVSIQVLNYSSTDQWLTVAGWIDFDGSGSWDIGESVAGLSGRILPPFEGAISMDSIDVPLSAKPGRSYARYRLYSRDPNAIVFSVLSPVGYGGWGEVEDYAVTIGDPIPIWVFSDPDPLAPGGWAFGEPNGSGGAEAGFPDPTSGYTGSEVYGVNLDGDYSPLVGGPYYLEFGPIYCADHTRVTLSFQRWLNSAPEVRNTVEVRNADTGWSVLWSSPSGAPITDDGWQYCEYDITEWAACHSHVYLRWGYEVLAETTAYSGWNLDDITLLGAPDNLVPFADVNLKAAVLNELVAIGASDLSTPPTYCQMLQLTSLDVRESDIRELGGLEYALNLEYLNANDNQIVDLSPLSGLHSLRELHIRRNRIRDLRPLADLTNLWNLSLSYNEIVDISPLARLTELTHLYLAYNQIAYIDVLDWSAMSGFNVLDLGDNLIDDIDSLSGLPRLWSLLLTNNEVEDISVLAEFPGLNRLTLNSNQITDIEALRGLSNLTYLHLVDNDLTPESCAVLDALRLSNPGIEIFEPASCAP